jgi:hypothetical protein
VAKQSGLTVCEFYCSWTPVVNTQYHVELDRGSDGTFYLFINGVSQTITTVTSLGTSKIPDYDGLFYIGAGTSSSRFTGYLDEFRVSKGVARHTANFTVPAGPYNLSIVTTYPEQPITAIMPYYNDQTDDFKLLIATGDGIYKRNPQTNEFEQLATAFTKNGIYSYTIRYDVMYIASIYDGLKKYLGGSQIEEVGTGSTKPGSFRQILYMKEIDRMFGIWDNAVLGQITWSNLSDPETWDGANVERFKLQDGERTEGGATLYGKLIIFNTYSIWIYFVQGNEENWRLEQAPTTIGCVAPATIRKVANEIWFLGQGPHNQLGVYAFNGSSCRLLSHDVEPLFRNANKNKLKSACAEVHDDVYRVSFAYGASETNNMALDFDLIHIKADGTPAIYGPHNIGFCSSAVLNNRQNSGEWLMGTEDGWVLKEGGTTVRSTNGANGQLLQHKFLSRIDNNDEYDIMKQLEQVCIYFRPKGFFNVDVNYYMGYGSFKNTLTMNPDANWVGFAGDFNVFFDHFSGTPEIYEFQEQCAMDARGTAFQIEIVNSSLGHSFAFDAIKLNFRSLYETKKISSYVP